MDTINPIKSMLISDITYTGHNIVSQCEMHLGKLVTIKSEYDIISHHLFPKINSELLISTSNQWWKWTWSQIFMNCNFTTIYLQQTDESEKYIVSKNIHTS
jgi:hypothetical protein